MFNKALWSSSSGSWSTPWDFFHMVDHEFNFDLDVAADYMNAKCDKYFDQDQDGLSQDWSGHVCWCNPPYGRQLSRWVKKAYESTRNPGTVVVMLIPARTDTSYFHDYILPFAEIRFIRGRLYFGGSKCPAPFGSMLVIFRS